MPGLPVTLMACCWGDRFKGEDEGPGVFVPASPAPVTAPDGEAMLGDYFGNE